MGRRQWSALVGAAAWVAVVGAGCEPRTSEAAVGMSVDRAGNPVIVLQNCRADITQLVLYDKNRPSAKISYENEQPVQEVVEIPLLTGTDGWRPDGTVPKPHPAGKFVVEAWSDGRKWLGRGTEFTLADLKTLKPGQVRHDWLRRDELPTYGASPATPQYRITSLDEFITDNCP